MIPGMCYERRWRRSALGSSSPFLERWVLPAGRRGCLFRVWEHSYRSSYRACDLGDLRGGNAYQREGDRARRMLEISALHTPICSAPTSAHSHI